MPAGSKRFFGFFCGNSCNLLRLRVFKYQMQEEEDDIELTPAEESAATDRNDWLGALAAAAFAFPAEGSV